MRSYKFYFLVITLFCFFSLTAKADTYSTFVTTKYYSKNRKYFVKVTPNKRATLYNGKRKIWTKLLPELPRNLLVTNNGKRVVMIENYYGNNNQGTKEVIIFFNEKGNKLSSQTLDNVADLKNVLHTTSNAYWLGNYELIQERNELFIETVTLACPLLNRLVSSWEESKKNDKCMEPKPDMKIGFSLIDGSILYKSKIEAAEK